MNLRLHYPYLAAQFLRCRYRFVNREAGNAARRHDAKLAQDFLSLILMNFHFASLLFGIKNLSESPALWRKPAAQHYRLSAIKRRSAHVMETIGTDGGANR